MSHPHCPKCAGKGEVVVDPASEGWRKVGDYWEHPAKGTLHVTTPDTPFLRFLCHCFHWTHEHAK